MTQAQSRSRAPITAGRGLLLSLLAAGTAVAWAATEPAQIPLSSRVAEPPTPNVLLTIDDSGSMLADFMPEGDYTLNGKTVNLNSNWIGGFPGDLRKLNNPNDVNDHPFPNGNYLVGVVISEKGANDAIYQMQFRSPDVNFIWYNPDIRYNPWYKPDGSGRMDNSTPSAARWDPVVSTGTFDLTKNVQYGNGATKWYTSRTATSTNGRWFYPGLVYRLKSGGDPTATGNYTRYDINATDGSHAPATKHPNRTDCAGSKCTQTEERQNFANWFTYYRMRESLTKAAVSESFVQFKDKLRVGWGRINNGTALNIDGSSKKYSVIESAANGGPMRPLDGTRLTKVLTGVQKVTSWPSTPLRTALDMASSYFDRSSYPKGSPWLTDPSNSGSEKLACRRSVSLLMTDGYYNDNYTDPAKIYDYDNTDGNKYTCHLDNKNNCPTQVQYKAVRPYIDAPNKLSNTLADVATKYYKVDLDTNIDNKVLPVTGDGAYWQHLTQYMVGLGVSGTLDSSSPAAKTATIKAITDGTKNWPDPTAGSPQKIDDMWHAAVNTGGDFYSVRNVTELTTALKAAFGAAAGNEAKEAGVATASGYVVAGNVKYVPKYKSVSWWGDLEAWPLGIDGREGDAVIWRASEHVPAAAQRNLYTWSGAAPSVQFTWSTMGSDNQAKVGSEKLTNYIRGDDSNTGFGGDYRSRDGKVLGDFVDAPPVMVKGLVDLGYSAFDSSYASFVSAKQSRPDGLVFVGGNDGMLHAFRTSDGVELYGYLPREGLSNLALIAAKDYGTTGNYHRFFVDGPINETDAFVKTPGASVAEWSNIVIGSMGAGGKTFFALHVPTDFGATLDAGDMTKNAVMWEVSGSSDPDVGYIFADFAVGKIKGGSWKAFVGNGVYSTNGNAVLLVVDMETGKIDKRLVVDTANDTGLMGVSLIKDETTKEVVGAYAGDLKGNLWRFDFQGDSDLQIGFDGKNPLFRATDASGKTQSITIAPSMVAHPENGRVVLFGTGRLIDEADSSSAAPQTYYGVWDPTKIGDTSVGASSPFDTVSKDREKLQQQIASTTLIDGKYLTVETKEVDWKTQLGWYMDLPFERQRVIFPSYILAKDFVLFSTSVPAVEAPMCASTTGVGYNYVLVAASGTNQDVPTYDTNGDGVIDKDDIIAAGFQTGNDGRDAILQKGDGDQQCKDGYVQYQDCHTGKTCEWINLHVPCGTPTLKDRIWQQIMNPPQPKAK